MWILTSSRSSQRLTRVQRDVLELMRDGWVIEVHHEAMLKKDGEASRHVRSNTFEALVNRGLIVNGGWVTWVWTLA